MVVIQMGSGAIMANYFILTLDTTGPNLEIIAPNYTIPRIENDIIIRSNEILTSAFQDIYFIDSKGLRYDLTFAYNGNEYVGKVKFNNVNTGIGILYAVLKDEVYNSSETASHTINVLKEYSLDIKLLDIKSNKTISTDYKNQIQNSLFKNNVTLKDNKNLVLNNDIRTINIEVKLMSVYETGNTVTLQGSFYHQDTDILMDPDEVKLKVYNSDYKQIDEVLLGASNKISTGVYEYKYTFEQKGIFYYEFYGLINGLPSLNRKKIEIKFIE